MKQTVYTRDVVLLMAAAFFYMCCSNSVAPIVAGYAESIGASSFWMGLISSLTTATAVVCRPVTGNLADKMDKRPLVVAGCLMMVAASAGYVLFPHVWCVAVLRVLHGTGYACCSIGMSTWLTLLLPPDRLASGVGAYGTVNALAMALAPVMGIRLKEFFWLPEQLPGSRFFRTDLHSAGASDRQRWCADRFRTETGGICRRSAGGAQCGAHRHRVGHHYDSLYRQQVFSGVLCG